MYCLFRFVYFNYLSDEYKNILGTNSQMNLQNYQAICSVAIISILISIITLCHFAHNSDFVHIYERKRMRREEKRKRMSSGAFSSGTTARRFSANKHQKKKKRKNRILAKKISGATQIFRLGSLFLHKYVQNKEGKQTKASKHSLLLNHRNQGVTEDFL